MENRTYFWKRDSKTISSRLKQCPSFKDAEPSLKYYYIRLSCIHGGQDSRSLKLIHRSKKQGCKAEIKVVLSPDRRYLVVANMVLEHNHSIPQF